ncbi:MAG: hypothetical protein M1817_001355 [Caeruleum heppii]|nr:MAG: hypothetical protein M1817_001355 [Caeruleum heppii]
MSDSGASTIPFTPTSFADDVSQDFDFDVFALLRPTNSNARTAFDAALNTVIKRGVEYRHLRQFFLAKRRPNSPASTFSEIDTGFDLESSPPMWIGSYKLSLETLPRDPSVGWLMGTGRYAGGDGETDLLLMPPTDKWTNEGIAGKHAIVSFHPESSRILIQARHSMTLGLGAQTVTGSQSRHFHSPAFATNLTRFLKLYRNKESFQNPLLSTASVGQPVSLGNYFCSPSAFAQGSFGRVTAGWTREGKTVAIKQFKKAVSSVIREHVRMMEHIGHHDCVMALMECVDHSKATVPDAYCVYTPLAVMDLYDMINTVAPDLAAKVALLADYAAGLAHLHSKDVMHRDITLRNLVIVSLSPPRGMLIDLDMATASQTSRDHMKGTMCFLAPEIIDLKDQGSTSPRPPPYDKSVDIWALGLCMFGLYFDSHFQWSHLARTCGLDPKDVLNVTRVVHAKFRDIIASRIKLQEDPTRISFLSLIVSMTEWNSIDQITAPKLHHEAQLANGEGGPGTIATTKGQKRDRGA